MLVVEADLKRCKKCLRWLYVDCFNKSEQHGDGLHPWCKFCYSIYHPTGRTRREERNQPARRQLPAPDIYSRKRCPRCKRVLPPGAFYLHERQGRKYLSSYCKDCTRACNKEWYRKLLGEKRGAKAKPT